MQAINEALSQLSSLPNGAKFKVITIERCLDLDYGVYFLYFTIKIYTTEEAIKIRINVDEKEIKFLPYFAKETNFLFRTGKKVKIERLIKLLEENKEKLSSMVFLYEK